MEISWNSVNQSHAQQLTCGSCQQKINEKDFFFNFKIEIEFNSEFPWDFDYKSLRCQLGAISLKHNAGHWTTIQEDREEIKQNSIRRKLPNQVARDLNDFLRQKDKIMTQVGCWINYFETMIFILKWWDIFLNISFFVVVLNPVSSNLIFKFVIENPAIEKLSRRWHRFWRFHNLNLFLILNLGIFTSKPYSLEKIWACQQAWNNIQVIVFLGWCISVQ